MNEWNFIKSEAVHIVVTLTSHVPYFDPYLQISVKTLYPLFSFHVAYDNALRIQGNVVTMYPDNIISMTT